MIKTTQHSKYFQGGFLVKLFKLCIEESSQNFDLYFLIPRLSLRVSIAGGRFAE